MKTRIILMVVLVGLAVALLASSWSSRRRVLRAGDVLAVGQGDSLVESAHRRLREVAPEDAATALTALLEDDRPAGLRFIALIAPDGRVLASAGTATFPWPPQAPPAAGVPERQGGLVRLAAGGGPPRRAGAPPPGADDPRDGGDPRRRDEELHPDGPPPFGPGSGSGRGMGRGGRPGDGRPPPMVVVEFEPFVATELEREATRTFAFGASAAFALVASALLLWTLLARADAASRRLADQRRLASLGEMSAVLAHEIRNPLASLKGHAQLLAESLEPATVQGRGAGRVVAEAVRLEKLATSLLDFVRTARVDPEAVDPAALLRECADEAGAGIVDVDARRAPPSWPLDPMRMKQVLRNLVDNAVQATPPGARVAARVALEGGSLVFEVRDHGAGLPAGDAEQLFEPFRTTRTNGTGLGLAVARRIVELHGGSIRAQAATGGGASFTVMLPPPSERRDSTL